MGAHPASARFVVVVVVVVEDGQTSASAAVAHGTSRRTVEAPCP